MSVPTLPAVASYLDRAGLLAEARVVALTGDASDRRYYRVLVPQRPSTVLQVNAEPFERDTLPFLSVAELFRRMPVPVPAILDCHADLGVVVLEDLGDVTLQAHLGAASPTEHEALYRSAVALIATLQRRGHELASPTALPYRVAFDVDKLGWEMRFFVKHFLIAYRGAVLSADAEASLQRELMTIVEELAAEPRVLCHRDFHSRNLMLHESRLYMIDFQDARLGPDTYDLASLLRDSYVDLPGETVDDLIGYFLELLGRPQPADAFRRRFDLMALQRNLKALGTFGYQTTARRNPVYIQYMPRTLRYVRDNLAGHRRFARLHALLAAHLEELRD